MIKNKTKKTILAHKKKTLSDMFSKARGLMLSKKINGEGYIFTFDTPRRIDLHMFFVFFPIDIIFLDSKKRVVEIKENFKPFCIYYPKKEASYAIELPSGAIKKSKTGLNDLICF